MKLWNKITMVGSLICMAGFVHASVYTDFMVAGGNVGSSVDVTWSNLNGPVTLGSTAGTDPLVDGVKNSFTATSGLSGTLKMNVLALDDLSGNFQPAIWMGGGQSVGNSVNAQDVRGWGVRRDGKINGDLQGAEALIFTFDLSALTLGAGQSVVLTGITFFEDDGSRNGDFWQRNFAIPLGTASAGTKLANDVTAWSGSRTVVDGDQFAVVRGLKDTRLAGLELDVVPEPLSLGLVLMGAGVLFVGRRVRPTHSR